MPIELLAKIGIGFLFGGLICSAVLSLIHRRAIKITIRRLESDFQHSATQVRSDKELLQTVINHARAQMIDLDKNQRAINRLSSELDGLKTEVDSLKTKIDPQLEHIVSISPTSPQAMLKETPSQANNAHQSIPHDTWTRDEPDGESMARVSQLTSADNSVDALTRTVGDDELRGLLGFPDNADQNKTSDTKKIGESAS
ncbi:MAG TPA: hypothetical protein VHT68_25765 [Pseudolabrys sp.]|nr:hypothetical protein [Pseudolabrys sp.]